MKRLIMSTSQLILKLLSTHNSTMVQVSYLSKMKASLILLIVLQIKFCNGQENTGNLFFQSPIGDKISLHENRLGNDNMYGFGVESSTLYYKSFGVYRWYIGQNADNGASSILDLDNTGFYLNFGSLLIQRGGELNFGWNGNLRAGISATNSSPYNELQFFTGNHIERMRIASDGYVGIGIKDPGAKLHVNGNIRTNGSLSLIANETSLGDIISLYGNRFGSNDMYGFGIETNGGVLYSKCVTGYNWYIGSNADRGTSALMTLRNSGLDVDGMIRSEEVLVEAVNPPDYVFEAGYYLRSLTETAEYIKANGHLPDVPSAADMVEQGIGLSEMNMLLLRKIEELTLHSITQETEIQNLKALVKTYKSLEERLQKLENKNND